MSVKLPLIKLLLRALALMPLGVQRWVGRRIGDGLWRWDRRSRRVSLRNLSLCFPELDDGAREQLARETLRHTGMAFAELGCSFYWSRQRLLDCVRFDDGERLQRALAEGQGVILASPHFGNWELAGQYLGLLHPMHVLYRPAKDAAVDAYILERRSRFGAHPHPTDASGVRAMSKALKQGELLGILPDQEPDLEGGVFAPFFGTEALTMTLLCKLARRRRTPVLLTSMRRTESGFALQLEAVDEAIYSDDLLAATGALNAAVEALARRHPEQYIWNYKRFATRPAGEARLY